MHDFLHTRRAMGEFPVSGHDVHTEQLGGVRHILTHGEFASIRDALAAATTVAGLAVVPFLAAPAQAAPASLTTTYSCSSSFGTESADVKLSADFPSSVTSGSTVAARRVGFSVTVPSRFVGYMRQFGVE